MMKKAVWFTWVLALALCLSSLAGCAQKPADGQPSGTAAAAPAELTPSPIPTPTPEPTPKSFELTGQIDEQVIYDEGGLVVKALSMEAKETAIDASTGEEKDVTPYVALNLSIENRTEMSVNVRAYATAVNGITTNDYCFIYLLSPGTSGEASFSLGDLNVFRLAGITDVAEVSFSLQFDDYDTWDLIAEATVTLSTGIAGSYTQQRPELQGVVYDQNGVTIMPLGKDLEGKYSFIRPGLMLYVENNTDQALWIDGRYDAKINGIDLGLADYDDFGAYSVSYILPGKCAYTSLIIEDWQMEIAGISSVADVHEIECAFVFSEMGDFENILLETPIVTMHFE